MSYIKNFDKINNKTKQTSINILGGEVQKQEDHLDEPKKGILQLTKKVIKFLLKWILIIIVVVIVLALVLLIFGIITSKIWVTILLAINTNSFMQLSS